MKPQNFHMSAVLVSSSSVPAAVVPAAAPAVAAAAAAVPVAAAARSHKYHKCRCIHQQRLGSTEGHGGGGRPIRHISHHAAAVAAAW